MKKGYVEFHKEARKQKIKEKIYNGLDKIQKWFERNRDYVIVFGPMVVAGVASMAKLAAKRSNIKKEEAVKNNYCYDRSLGHYWALKRDLSNKEWLEVDRRKRDGERLADILSEMKVLK